MLRTSLIAAALLAFGGLAQAQQAPDASKPNPSAATSTGTTTSQAEMNRGVPGVNVDVGRNARGGANVDVDRNTDSRNVTNRGTDSRNLTDRGERAARADRN
jgi:hypothetical protein